MLSDWSLSNKQIFSNKKILELGSGVGFTGITIAKHCGIESMLMTDCHNEVLKTIDENIQINFPSISNPQIDKITLYKAENKIIGNIIIFCF